MMISDQSIREKALNPTRSFIVQAPAGSGKTELLTQRYLTLLSHAKKAPEEIVAITFTRKAAAEMRLRIMQALLMAKEPEPDKNDYRHLTWHLANQVNQKNHALQWRLHQNPNRLRIMTIDALSTFLCRHTPLLTDFGVSPQIGEYPERLYQEAVKRFIVYLSRTKEYQPTLTQLLLHMDNKVDQLEKFMIDLLNHRDQWLPHLLNCHADSDLLKKQLELGLQRVVLEKIQSAYELIPESIKQSLMLCAHYAASQIQEHDPSNSIRFCEHFSLSKKPSLSDFSSWLGISHLLLTDKGSWRKQVSATIGFPKKCEMKSQLIELLSYLQHHEKLRVTLYDIQFCPSLTYSNQQWNTLIALTQLLPLLAAQLALLFQEKGQIDFVALNLAAQKALGNDENPTDLALYLDYQIQHLLIDEFQDTSIVHLNIIEKIIAGWECNDGRTLFLVGDPMQSIYRFRNAEVGLFLRIQQQGLGQVSLEPLTLTSNFRSDARLVDWFNDTFSTIFPVTADISTGRVPFAKAIAVNKTKLDESVYINLLCDANDELEAKSIITCIQEIQSRYPNDHIALLVRTRSQLFSITAQLRKAKIYFQGIDLEPLTHLAEIQDLLSLTRALLHRADRLAWLSVLRTPFCGLSLIDLHIVANYNSQHTLWETILTVDAITNLSTDGLKRLHRIRTCFQNAFLHQTHFSLSRWIENVWIQLGGHETLSTSSAIHHVREFFKLMDTLLHDSIVFSVEQFSEALNKLFAKPRTDLQCSLSIMTIHKSKGLEFDHVIISGLHRKTMHHSQKLLRWIERPNALGSSDLILAPIKFAADKKDLIYNYVKKMEEEKLDHELTRLLYVAATRAKKSLHFFAQIERDSKKSVLPKNPSKGNFLEKLWPIIETRAKTVCQSPHIEQCKSTTSKNLIIASFRRIPNDWQSNISIDKSFQDKKRIFIPVSLSSQSARITGTIIHNVFQEITEEGLKQWLSNQSQKINHWKSRLKIAGILPHEMDESLRLTQQAVFNAISDERGQWILSNTHDESFCELPLSFFHENEIQQVIIDRTFVDQHNIRWIIDYKTASPESNEKLELFLENQKKLHQQQLTRYAAIMSRIDQRAIRLGLYFPICNGWIEWVLKT